MLFTVIKRKSPLPSDTSERAFLVDDRWDDMGDFETLYHLVFFDSANKRHDIGAVKIGQLAMKEAQRKPELEQQFDAVDQSCFSLGQDVSYYEKLNKLTFSFRTKLLEGLRDLANDDVLYERASNERVTTISLMRGIAETTVKGQFKRVIEGGATLSPYNFTFTSPSKNPYSLSFDVKPDSMPPTNLHVLIGRNGVGKTWLLNEMTRSLIKFPANQTSGQFTSEAATRESHDKLFASVVGVSFSAFDAFTPYPQDRSRNDIQYSYVGLQREGQSNSLKTSVPKSPSDLALEFSDSVAACHRLKGRLVRWRRALRTLESDVGFQQAGVAALAINVNRRAEAPNAAMVFNQLSSGHKIVLLTITRLVELVEERTLVLIDEPEAHLHPPLLAAFIRALSDLLINRNGVAIIATHSPVVLQEVPTQCTWKMQRNGSSVVVERPEIETFGENVGVLTREVFGLEVTESGFHRMVKDNARRKTTLRAIEATFDGQLGGEARALARGIAVANQRKDK